MQGKVLILLSTYNGEKYLREQLDSLFIQDCPIQLLVRDDGSTDGTLSILEEYSEKYSEMQFIKGENVGFYKSYNLLMSEHIVDQFEWIAFCDQDDVWLPDKISSAVKMMKDGYNPTIPTMYCSNLTMVDENLNKLRMMHKPSLKWTKESILVQNPATGCTVVFNQAAAALYRRGIDLPMVAHDYSMLLACAYMGKVVYDNGSYIQYRQHGKNAIGGGSKGVFVGIKDILSDLFKPKPQKRVEWFRSFVEIYNNDLGENKRIINTVVSYKKNFKNRLILVFSVRFKGYDTKTTVAFKIRALLGRLY